MSFMKINAAMPKISNLLSGYDIPEVVKVRQTFCGDLLENVENELWKQLELTCKPFSPGARIAITCGSRGIDQYALLVKTIARFVREKGGTPFLVPSMGSHGGATAEGQAEVLRHYGITEENVGAPIISSMEVKQIGVTSKGLPVYIDKNACEADGIILLNRVKPHTSFRGRYESGLVKMLAIGLAKQKGAEMTHFLRFENMAENIVDVGSIGLEKLNVLCGVATVENGYNCIAELHVLAKEDILKKEPALLETARKMMPRISLDTVDVLVIKEIGKEISGTGMDTNIVGRYHTRAASGGPETIKLGVLNVTDKSEGNANGIGLADFMPRHMYEQMNFEVSYMNTITSTEPSSTRIPMVLGNDKEVFQACIKLCGQVDPRKIRMVIIRSTKYLDEVYMSKAAVEEAMETGAIPVEVIGEFHALPFDEEGNMTLFS